MKLFQAYIPKQEFFYDSYGGNEGKYTIPKTQR